MKQLFTALIFVSIVYPSVGQRSRFSSPPQMYVPQTDMGLGDVTRALQLANARVESNNNSIKPLIDLNIEILTDKIKSGCDSKIVDFYNSRIDQLKKRDYSLNSTQDVADLKKELTSLRSALINFNCSDTYTNRTVPATTLEEKKEIKSVSSTSSGSSSSINMGKGYMYQGIYGKGFLTERTKVWDKFVVSKASLIEKLDKNADVNIVGVYMYNNKSYYQIILENGKSGYISSKSVKLR